MTMYCIIISSYANYFPIALSFYLGMPMLLDHHGKLQKEPALNSS